MEEIGFEIFTPHGMTRKRMNGIDSDELEDPSSLVHEVIPPRTEIVYGKEEMENEAVNESDKEERRRTAGGVKTKRISSKGKEISADDANKKAFELISRMKNVYKKDEESLREGRPALFKLEEVEGLYYSVIKKDLQRPCIEMGILNEITRWLEPSPDKNLPTQKVKKVLLELLQRIHVHKGDLMNCRIGRIVNFYSKNRKETKEIRKMAEVVVEKWKAMILREEYGEE